MNQPFKKVSGISMFVDPLLWPYRRPSKLYVVSSVVDMAVQFTCLIVYGMLQPFAALAIYVNIVITGGFRLLLVSRFVHFAESQSDKSDTEMKTFQEESAAGITNSSLVVANPMNDLALSRDGDGEIGGIDFVIERSVHKSEEQDEENEDNDNLSKLTKEALIAIALPVFKEPTLCVVASLLPVVITATLFLTLIFLDMALDRAPMSECVWIPCAMCLVPGLFYVLLHRQWFALSFVQLFAMTAEDQTSSQAQPAVQLSDSATASQEQPRHVEHESDTNYGVSDSGDLSFANSFAGSRA